MKLKATFDLFKEIIAEWNKDKAPRLAAALAYYAIFSIAPLLIVAIWIAGLIYGQQAAEGHIVDQIQSIVGKNGAAVIQTMIDGASRTPSGWLASVIGIVALFFGATGLFGQVQDALDTIWEIPPRSAKSIKLSLIILVKEKLLAFAMVLLIGILLLLSLAASAILSGVSQFLSDTAPERLFVLQVINFALPFGIVALLSAIVYKILPDTSIAWKDVWPGAALTSLLFTLGKYLIGSYLAHSSVASIYGAAGSLVVLLLWIYYSAQIFLFGAEFTEVYARRFGSRAEPISPPHPPVPSPELNPATLADSGQGQAAGKPGQRNSGEGE